MHFKYFSSYRLKFVKSISITKMLKTTKILPVNVREMNNKIKLKWITSQMLKMWPDIVFLQETHIRHHNIRLKIIKRLSPAIWWLYIISLYAPNEKQMSFLRRCFESTEGLPRRQFHLKRGTKLHFRFQTKQISTIKEN